LNYGDRNQNVSLVELRFQPNLRKPKVFARWPAESEIMNAVGLCLSKWLDVRTDSTIACALDELEGRIAYELIRVCFRLPVLSAFVRHAVSGGAGTDAISCAAIFRSVFPFASHV